MKVIKISAILLLIISVNTLTYSQEYKYEELYIKLLKELFVEKVFKAEVLKVEFDNKNHCYLGNECEYIHPDKSLDFSYKEDTVNVWPVKKVFFYGINTWIRLFDCKITLEEATINFEIILDNKLTTTGNILFIAKNNEWTIKKKNINNLSQPVPYVPPALRNK